MLPSNHDHSPTARPDGGEAPSSRTRREDASVTIESLVDGEERLVRVCEPRDSGGDATGVPAPRQSTEEDWHTVTVADAYSSAEDFLATLKRDLERSLASAQPRPRGSPLVAPLPPPSSSVDDPLALRARHSCVVPNTVLVRLAVLEPFMRGATVFDPTHHGAASIWLNGEPFDTLHAFRERLQTALAECIESAAERHTMLQVLLLLVHARFSKLCVDAAKLAFGAPSLRLQHQNVEVTCTRKRVGFQSTGRISRTRVHQALDEEPGTRSFSGSATADATSPHGPGNDVTMTVSWTFTPIHPTSSVWGSFASCLTALATCPGVRAAGEGPSGEVDEDTAAVVTFDYPLRR